MGTDKKMPVILHVAVTYPARSARVRVRGGECFAHLQLVSLDARTRATGEGQLLDEEVGCNRLLSIVYQRRAFSFRAFSLKIAHLLKKRSVSCIRIAGTGNSKSAVRKLLLQSRKHPCSARNSAKSQAIRMPKLKEGGTSCPCWADSCNLAGH